jgi:hypothetical protein
VSALVVAPFTRESFALGVRKRSNTAGTSTASLRDAGRLVIAVRALLDRATASRLRRRRTILNLFGLSQRLDRLFDAEENRRLE